MLKAGDQVNYFHWPQRPPAKPVVTPATIVNVNPKGRIQINASGKLKYVNPDNLQRA